MKKFLQLQITLYRIFYLVKDLDKFEVFKIFEHKVFDFGAISQEGRLVGDRQGA